MDLFEYQGKQYFARYGIPVSAGGVADTVDEAVARSRQGRATRWWSRPRSRWAGGARPAASSWPRTPTRCAPTPATSSGSTSRATSSGGSGSSTPPTSPRSTTPASRWTGRPRSTWAWCRPRAASRSRRWPTRTPTPSPGSTSTPRSASTEADARELVERGRARPGGRRRRGRTSCIKLYRCYVEGDADLVEINPLILTPDGRVHALDAKVTLDDNAAFRHPEWDEFRDIDELDERERLARRRACSTSASTASSASSPTAPAWP